MEELDLKELFDYFLSKFYILIIITFCCVVISMVYGVFLKKPMYKSYTTLALVGKNEDQNGNGITTSDMTLNQKLVPTYREIIKSRGILTRVIENLELNISYESLKSSISVTSESDTDLIRITVSYEDPKIACDTASEIAKVFSEEIVNIYNIQNVRVIEDAIIATGPYNINFTKQLIITLAIAIFLSLADIFVLYYFDTSIKTVEEVEKKLNLPILGAVPDSAHKGGYRK